MREAELNCNKLYKEMSGSNAKHMTKIHESQQKFEEASLMIGKQSAMVDDLNGQIEKLKEVNSQLDYSWGKKYQEMNSIRETEFDQMKKDLTHQLDKEKRTNAEKMKDLITDFKQDMQVVEGTHQRKSTERTQQMLKLE